ncbi:prepilin-type N-terminal cleavage/methylation domain-containing protein [Shewanella alkalitolerans]|uniref:type IV pilin protein n=1 Tax=Shewanella alkalitolerans TaxID=2864209 RepID=UPI001C661021|nr:type IV pilin protein [Shewanella alkalitolerans]QYJ98702.1 prepilin-type N-terminal cleavage/methylation domain-containing protein [Shewanella alkalitolerans]
MDKMKGFTLIEVMIVVVIIGILAAIAYPSYIDFVTKSGRSEGVAAVMRAANLQEQYYLDNRQYASSMADLGLGNGTTFNTEHDLYTLSAIGGSSFTVKAVANEPQKSRDSVCKTISITSSGVKGPSAECWK